MINRAITVAGGNPWGDASNTFNYPFGNFVDKAGNVYVADYNNNRIQKWAPGATSGTTVAGGNGYGSGGNQLAHPYDVFVDDNGVIYVSDAGNYRVQAWFPGAVNGITVAGGNGYGAASNQISPRGIWVDKSGNIYVADMFNNRIQMWIPGMGTGITVAGGNGGGSASNQLNAPTGIYIDNEGEIYVTDNGNHRVQKWTLGALTGITVAGGNGQGAAANQLYLPEESFLDSQGNLIIIDRSNKRIQKWEQNATSGTTIWGALAFGYIVSQLTNPTGIFIDECDHIYLTALGGDNAIKKLIKVPAIVASGPTTFCTGDSVTLTTSQGYTYLWNNNETGQSITVKSSGEYSVTVTDLKGCSSVSDKVIVKEVPPPPTPAITAAGSTSLCNGSTVMLSSSGTDIKWYKNGKLWSTGNNLTVSLEGNYTAKSFVVCESPPSNIISVTRGYTPSPPVITATGSTTLCNGSTVTLTSTGSGIVWSNGQTGNTITVSTAGNYTATASNYCGTSGASNIISVTADYESSAPIIRALGSTILCNGAETILSSTGTGVQWYRNGSILYGATGPYYVARLGGNYTAVSINSCGSSPASNIISLTIEAAPPAPVISTTGTTLLCNGANIILSSTGSNIQWYRNDVIISGATSTSYTASAAGNYSSRSSNNCGTSQASNIVVISTSETSTAPIIAAYGSTTFCEGGGVNLTATGSGIKWYKNLVAIPDATGPSYFATSTGSYTATSANSCGISPQSLGILISMEPIVPRMPVITAHGPVTFCSGGSVLLSTAGSGIQWYKDGLAIAGATATNYTATISGSYTVTSMNSCGQSFISSAMVVTSESGIPAAPIITSSGSTSICDGSSVTLSSNTIVSWYHNSSFVGSGSTSAATLRGTYTARAINSCGISKASNAISVTINPMLRVKTSRFDQVIVQTSNQDIPDTAAIASSSAAQLNDHVNSICEGYADQWMSELAAGLESYPQAMRDTLRIKMIEICTAGGDMSHPFGASTLPPGRVSASGYSSFAEAMKDVLGLNTFTASLNPWLLSSPYPYSTVMQATEKYLSITDSTLCARLQQLQTEHQASYPGATFYQYLKNQYGAAMNITAAQLDILVKSCASCNYILEKDIPLPVFIEPGAKGCITASDYNTAMAGLNNEFNTGLPDSRANYETIVTTYLNHTWGFTLSYGKYKDFEDQLPANPSAILCNQPAYESIKADPYAEVKNIIAIAAANGKRDYAAYITEEKRKFAQSYIDTCAAAKVSVDLTKEEQVYHYTLYYYDQADNLVRTIPPEGVAFLTDDEVASVTDYRKKNAPECNNYDGPASNSDKGTALQKLSDMFASDTVRAIEMWLYNPNKNGGQVVASTPDRKFMFQTCLIGNLLDINIFTLEPDTISGAISFISSHHAMADLTLTPSLSSWTHVLFQSDSLRGGDIQIYVNGILRPLLPWDPETTQNGCGWEINDPQALPENLTILKHLRFYDRLLNASEITANASNECFNLDPPRKTQLQLNLLAWYRFNTPRAGDLTTVASNTTIETSINPVYPDHGLPTTYAYNSTNQVMMQHTPDGGTSRFWYDHLSRLTASQNAKQKAEDKYSYTKYDVLGRITEVGEKAFAGSGLVDPGYLDSAAVNLFLASGANSQITQTLYDSIPVPGNGIQALHQENLRKRVAASLYREADSSSVKQASYYNYDLNGNVKTLYQSVYGLGIKTLDYEYDLVSGKVNFLRYQAGRPDQFYYQYKYDAENRLTEAWSGTKALVKPFGRSYLMDGKLDASYEYYLHGTLARMELGDQYGKVQGVDYAYTLQGWLKGVNGQKLDATKEIGEDGEVVAKDALAYSLGYYAGDYKPIGGTGSSAFGMQYQGQVGDITGQNLYNGNISNTTVAISKFRNGDPVGYTYKYDQLNRLKEMRQHELAASATSWDAASMVDKYKESISYDGNGNIRSFLRNGTTEDSKPLAMDNLTYSYSKDGNNRLVNNRLRHVNDAVAGSNYTEDLDDQGDDNYSYDAIGNLVKDTQEGIDSISWTVYGKIKSISKTNGTYITYNYDPSGNRVSKSVFTPSQGALMTWYIRDAQGNTMGVYDNWNCGINWKEQQLYGSSRLGMWKPNINLNTVTDSSLSVWDTVIKKVYELNNHLGNVLAAISDKRMLVNGTYEAEVLSAQDYYSFGSFQTGRNWTLGDSYRYGFNGKEDDNEVKGVGNSLDFGARIYDSRIGSFLSVDPKAAKMPAWSPYSFGFNNPIHFIDPDGQEPTPAEAARMASHVYGDKKNSILTGGWRVSSRNFGIQLQTEAGLKSLVYERVVNGKVIEYTYATAGTENGKDWRENGKQPFGLSAQYEQAADNAKVLSKALNNTELNFVGHSLGGGEAALNSLVTSDEKLIGRKAFTFNAAGVGDITKFSEGTWKIPFKSESKIDAYILRTDPLNLLQNNSPIMPDVNGNRNYLFPKDLPSTYNGHSIDNIIKNFGVTNPDKYKK